MLFAVAHALQLEDGSYAVRSPEFPGCEARSTRIELAREQFGDVLRDRLVAMIAAGEVPALYTYEELATSFSERCKVQMVAPDRLPGTFDKVMAVRATLAPEAATRIKTVRAAPQRAEPERDPNAATANGNAPPPDTTAAPDATPRLQPSARMALAAAKLAKRDRHGG